MISETDITRYLGRVADSGVLGKSERRLRLLEHLIRTEVNGAGASLKAYSIGIDVLDRPDDFDPTVDSSVRVEMGRLRTALVQFENSAKADTKVSVAIPVGSYRPTIQLGADGGSGALPNRRTLKVGAFFGVTALSIIGLAQLALNFFQPRADPPETSTEFGVRVAMATFEGDPLLTAQVESALQRSLVRSQSIAIIAQPKLDAVAVDFSLSGLVNQLNDGLWRVSIALENIHTNRIVWTDTIVLPSEDDFEGEVGAVLGDDLRLRLLGASKDFLEGRDPARLTPEQLFIMATWIPSPTTINSRVWEEERIALMEMALERKPDLGKPHSVMADKLAQMANFYPESDTQELHDAALNHIQRATELDPFNPDVMFNIAQSHWHAGRISQSHLTMRRVLDLDPGHNLARFLSDVIPYTCVVPGVEVIENAVSFDGSLAPDNPIRWITLTWVSWLLALSGDYQSALEKKQEASLIFESPYTFMGHAMMLNQIGEVEQAAELLRLQRLNWPDISPDHFAEVTMPRLCSEATLRPKILRDYEDLAVAMRGRL